MAKASLISFNKFIGLLSVRERRDRRERFDLKNVPVSTTTYTRAFFGVNQASNLMKITQQYQQYIDVYPTIDKNSFARSFDYWETKKLVWPDLYLAIYKAHNFALSSTSNERHIGICRVADSPQTRASTWPTFCRNAFLRCNNFIIG